MKSEVVSTEEKNGYARVHLQATEIPAPAMKTTLLWLVQISFASSESDEFPRELRRRPGCSSAVASILLLERRRRRLGFIFYQARSFDCSMAGNLLVRDVTAEWGIAQGNFE